MADILDVTGPNEKRKQLLAWLMQQMGQSSGGNRGALAASAAASPAARSQAAGRSIFNRADTRSGGVHVTQSSNVPANLRALLGPGGFGLPTAAEHSRAPGLPVERTAAPILPARAGAGHAPDQLPVGIPDRPADVGLAPTGPAAPANQVSAAPSAGAMPGGGDLFGGLSSPANPVKVTPNSPTFAGAPLMSAFAKALAQILNTNTDPHISSPSAQAAGQMGSYQPL